MPVRVYGEDETHTLVHYDFEGNWTWDELYPAYYQAIEMEKSVSHRVDVILDMRQSKKIPSNALMHIKNISDKQPPNIGLSVIVTNSAFLASMYKIGVQFYAKIGHYFFLTTSLDEARQMIAKSRATVQPDKSQASTDALVPILGVSENLSHNVLKFFVFSYQLQAIGYKLSAIS
ncbi:MAG: hypothetical protein ABI690_03095 [Chloroflexota bacterium]